MPNYLVLAFESALAVFGIRSGYEQPSYDVVERIGPVEIRRYGPCLAAETTVRAESEAKARDQAFRTLAAYIFGQNRTKADLAMTAPVATRAAGRELAMTALGETRDAAQEIAMTAPVATASREPGSYTQRFFLPKAITRETAPVPLDPRVTIVDLPEEMVAALTFSGRWGEAELAEKKRALLRALAASSWQAAEQPGTLFYDPPFTIPFLRRNEVAVRVAPTTS